MSARIDCNFHIFKFNTHHVYSGGQKAMWHFLLRLVYTLVVTGIVETEICFNVYIDTGTSQICTLYCALKNTQEREYV